jgi:hypothetical protein
MAGSTVTTFDALLKERYADSSIVEKLVYPENPLLAKLQNTGDTEMVGDTMPVPIFSALPQGLSAGFTTAQTNAGTTGGNTASYKWQITAGDYYGVVYIGDKVIQASRNNKGAFLANKEIEIDGLFEQAGENMSVYTWGNGGQAIGRRATLTGNDVQLIQDIDGQNFEVGMTLKASVADGSTSTDTQRAGTSATVTGINRATGVVTSTSWGNITAFGDNDFLFREGDFFGDQGVIVIRGVQAFITASDAPPALWGITAAARATDPQRYAGCRVQQSTIQGKTYEERIKILIAQMTGRFKAKAPTAGYMNPEDWQVLETLMTARGVRPLEDDSTKFGFSSISIATSGGSIPIYCDRHCPKGTFFALRMADWGLSCMGELLHFQNGDGMEVLRVYNSTNYEARLISYPLLYCRAPKNSGRVSLQ